MPTLSTRYTLDRDSLRKLLWGEVYSTLNGLLGNSGATTVPKATASSLGVIRPGANFTVDGSGVLTLASALDLTSVSVQKDNTHGLLIGTSASGTRLYSTAAGADTLDVTSVVNSVSGGWGITATKTGRILSIDNTGVLSFNSRTGGVTLTSNDVTTALGYTPTNPASGAVEQTVSSPMNFTGSVQLPVTLVNGRMTITGSTSSQSYLRIGVGSAPTTPALGDIWLQASGLWYKTTASAAVRALTTSDTYVSTFNTRSGAVTLTSSDVTTALTYTPPSQAVCAVKKGVFQSITGDGSMHALDYETEFVDTDSMHSVTAGQRHKITIPTAGTYRVVAKVKFQAGSSSGTVNVMVYRYNSSAVLQPTVAGASEAITGGAAMTFNLEGMATCSVGDYLTVEVGHDTSTGGGVYQEYDSYFAVEKVAG